MKVFITGVSSGVGKALTTQLIRDGHEVWGIARRSELLSQLQKELGSDKFHFSAGDISADVTVDSAISDFKKNNFLPDVVVLNAGLFYQDTDPQFNCDTLKKVYGVNVFGALVWVDRLIAEFVKRGSGTFIAISSTSVHRPDAKSVSLPSSKAALSMAFRSLRLCYAKDSISFHTVHFGPIATTLTPQWQSRSGGPRYPFVMTAEEAARGISKAIYGKKAVYWFPFFTTFLFRITSFIPDRFFVLLTQFLKKK
ncbi:MAG: SDR family NAD(P)-dependent oxidoreductase [bacterium]|nr:SDR family NAD(P)-dependent oxidoreductase [bacterium]